EVGIRDFHVTGVQTCALPIWAEIDAVCVGTPHYSSRELERLRSLLDGRRCRLPLYVNTSRAALDEFGRGPDLEACGVRIVTDTRSEERRVGKACSPPWPSVMV